MKVLTWNCNGALRRKIKWLTPFKADIMVVQECENPATTNDSAYKTWAKNYFWAGKNNTKGLGLFAGENSTIKNLQWDTDG